MTRGHIAIGRIAIFLLWIAASAVSPALAATSATGIIVRDQVAMRAEPRDSARQQAMLWQGEVVELRGERLDYFQVYDYRRERGGFVRANQIRRLKLGHDEAPELLSILRFVRDTPGAEALGIGIAAAYIQAASAEMLQGDAGIEAIDALGVVSERLARRATSGGGSTANGASAKNPLSRAGEEALLAHLDVAARHGIAFVSYEHDGRMQICYDGAMFRRVLAMRSTSEQRARAVLALTRSECADPTLRPPERAKMDEWRAATLDQVDAAALPVYLKNRLLMRRAAVWSSIAYQRARQGEAADVAASRAIAEFSGVAKLELPDEDLKIFNDTAMRVNASRWAAVPAPVMEPTDKLRDLTIVTESRQPGETCVSLVDTKADVKNPLATRCTYGLVWNSSATFNREKTALALAVQPLDAWREVWIFRKEGKTWTINVLPPASVTPGIGYVEFAGWVPGGKQMLVAREARGENKYKRNFELLRLDTLITERQTGDPTMLGAFQRWQDPVWKRNTLSLR